MKKQERINTVRNNDDFSSGLMEQYGKWMGGDCFQNTDLPDIHLSEAPFDGMDPQSNGAEIEKITTKKKGPKKESPKAQLATKEEVVITCEKCGGDHDSADCPNILEREEVEIDGEIMVLEKIRVENWDKMDEGSLQQARKNIGRDPDKPSCWKGYKAKGTKMKGGKSVPNCVKEEEKVDTGHVYKKKKGEKTMKYADGVNEQLRAHLEELRARYREKVEKMYEGYGKKKKKMGYK